jgi:probable rRNA maturation factor
MKSDPHITFRRKPAALDLDSLESFAQTLRRRVARGREFHCLFTNDAELRSLNLQFRHKDEPTDVLSFPSGSPHTIGDIAISITRARAQAREWGHGLEDELRILMLHGVLHLKGMDHETDSGEMLRAEMRWRRKLSLPVSLIERVRRGEEQ